MDVEPGWMEDNCVRPALFQLEYADGFRATTLMLDRHVRGFAYAARVNGETVSTGFHTGDTTIHESFGAQGLCRPGDVPDRDSRNTPSSAAF